MPSLRGHDHTQEWQLCAASLALNGRQEVRVQRHLCRDCGRTGVRPYKNQVGRSPDRLVLRRGMRPQAIGRRFLMLPLCRLLIDADCDILWPVSWILSSEDSQWT